MEHTKRTCINQTMGGIEDWRQILYGKLHIATSHYGNGIDVNESTANSRLIAASPALLEMCIEALNALNQIPNKGLTGKFKNTYAVCSELGKVIAKATGN